MQLAPTLVVLETAGTATQLNLGTMVRLGDQWKLIALPAPNFRW